MDFVPVGFGFCLLCIGVPLIVMIVWTELLLRKVFGSTLSQSGCNFPALKFGHVSLHSLEVFVSFLYWFGFISGPVGTERPSFKPGFGELRSNLALFPSDGGGGYRGGLGQDVKTRMGPSICKAFIGVMVDPLIGHRDKVTVRGPVVMDPKCSVDLCLECCYFWYWLANIIKRLDLVIDIAN